MRRGRFYDGRDRYSRQAAAPPGPTELFPDPTLATVADDTNGWSFSDGSPFMGPTGGTGPGISVATTFLASGSLAGDNETAFNAAVSIGLNVSVSITFANYVNGMLASVAVRAAEVEFAPSGNGVVTHSVVAGAGSGFAMSTNDGAAAFGNTHISVTAV